MYTTNQPWTVEQNRLLAYISAKHGKAATSGGMFPVKFFPERFLNDDNRLHIYIYIVSGSDGDEGFIFIYIIIIRNN
jgi:hypothetical protein